MPKLLSMAAFSLESIQIQIPVNLVWNSKRDMLAHYNKSNISLTTSLIEHNMKAIWSLRDTIKLTLRVMMLLNCSKLMKVYMKAGTM